MCLLKQSTTNQKIKLWRVRTMEKTLFEQMGGTYTRVGDYFLPDLKLPEEETKPISIWGQRHAKYLKQKHKVLYMNLLTSGKLNRYLADIDKQWEEVFSRLVKQIAEREDVTEQLKADKQLKWVAQMNNIYSRVTEIVNKDLIYS